MNKAFLFVIMLVSVSFVGCIEDSSDELSTEDTTSDETQDYANQTHFNDLMKKHKLSENEKLKREIR